ncbi:MAG: hypothetical protein FJZ43_04630 [Candidatus Staskawiczbacteria bacterium]|nr:hypothetical protein [Candidatus Staskawiczbacteria bacterium]
MENESTINVLRKFNSNKHFGNPFIADVSIKDSVLAYIEWLTSDKYATIEPERRQWIKEQLYLGKLKYKPISYHREFGEPTHATALDFLINKHN